MLGHLSPQDFYEKIKNHQSLTIIDIRDPNEFNNWNLYQSINIPFNKLAKKIKKISKKLEIVTICNRGNDSSRAAKMLLQMGFQAQSLSGGLKQWNKIYDIVEVEPSNMSDITVYQVKRLGKGCLSYIVVLPNKKSTIIIDPSYSINVYVDFHKKYKMKPIAVVDTHIHADHVSGTVKLARKYSVPVLMSEQSTVRFKFKKLEKFLPKFFTNSNIQVIHTPGHTSESISIAIGQSYLLTGDTLFLDSIGRTDLTADDGAKSSDIYNSIVDKLFNFDDDIFILPAHSSTAMVPGPVKGATLRYVKRFNIISEIKSSADYVLKVTQSNQITPDNYIKIKNINTKGQMSRKIDIDELELSNNHCSLTVLS